MSTQNAGWRKKKGPRKYHSKVKAFCAYCAIEHGTDSEQIKKADALIMLSIMCFAFAALERARMFGQAK